MQGDKFHAGQTFLIDIPNRDKKHLFIIVLEPEKVTGRAIFVPVDSHNYDGCPTVELHAGDHEFITKQSYVTFKFARVEAVAWLEDWIKQGKAKPMGSISEEILQKIYEKLSFSHIVKNEVLEFFSSQTWKI